MSFSKSKAERFPSYSHGSAALGVLRKNEKRACLHESLCTATTATSTIKSSQGAPNSHPRTQSQGKIISSKSNSTGGKKKIMPKLALAAKGSTSFRFSGATNKNGKMITPLKKSTGTETPKRCMSGKRTAANARLSSSGAKCNKVVIISPLLQDEVYSTPPISPSICDDDEGKDQDGKASNESKEQNSVYHTPHQETEADQMPDAATTVGRNQRLSRRSFRSQQGSFNGPSPTVITPRTANANHTPVPTSETEQNSRLPGAVRLSESEFNATRVVTSAWTSSSQNYLNHSLHEQDSIEDTDFSFNPLASSVLWSSDEDEGATIVLTSSRNPSRRASTSDIIRGFDYDTSNYSDTVRQNSVLHHPNNFDGRNYSQRSSIFTRVLLSLFHKKDKRNDDFPHSNRSICGLNTLLQGNENQNPLAGIRGRRNCQQNWYHCCQWIVDGAIRLQLQVKRDSRRIWRRVRRDGRKAVKNARVYLIPVKFYVRDERFWMPVAEFVASQLIEAITMRS